MPVPAAVLIALAVVGLAVWAIRRDVRTRRRKAELLSTMGFQRLERPDPQDAEAILQMYRRGRARGRRLRLRNAFGCDCPGGHLYVFDVENPGQRQSSLATSAVGVVRRGTGLPAFEIYGLAEKDKDGPVAGWVTSLVGKALGHGKVLPFDDHPAFARRFMVLSPGEEGEEAVRRYLSLEVREALLGFRFMSLVAEGDAFGLQVNPFMGPKPGDEVGALRGLVEEAGRMARVLEPASPSSARRGQEAR
jgi:hypothetical protein